MNDPAGVLRARVEEAVAELRELRCTDRAAAAAVRVVRLTVHTLEHLWLPALDRDER